MTKTISRRTVLQASAGLATSSAIQTASAVSGQTLEKLRVGAIGVGAQGRFLAGRFQANPQIQVVAVSDCNYAQMDKAQRVLPHQVEKYQDFRRLLDSKDIDAVVIATPDHWHCLMGILACQAGKDIYVEKPLSLCIEEGRQLIRHARLHDRVVQVGLMQRSGERYREAVEIVQSGQLGKISVVKAWNIYNRLPGGKRGPYGKPPNHLDWDLWLGPRPVRPFDPGLGGGFRWVWDFAGGNITDRGTHTMDTILQAMDARYPERICAVGGKYVFTDKEDVRETPDTLNVLYDFGDWTLHYEAREANHRVNWPSGYGMVFLGTEASLYVDRGGYRLHKERNRETVTGDDRVVGTPGKGPFTSIHALFDPHIQDFVESIATRKRPVCDVEIGHRSSNVSHLGNISYHTKSMLAWDGVREVCQDDEEAQRLTQREYRKPWLLPRI